MTVAVLATVGAATPPPPVGGTISVEQPAVAAGVQPGAAPPVFADAVGAALGVRGFTLLSEPGHSAYVVELTLVRAEVGTGSARVRGERGTITPGGMGGVGGGVTLPLSATQTRAVPLQRVRLDLRIRRRVDGAIVWHGAAVTVRTAGTREGRDEAIAAALSEALLRFYPNPPPGLVAVP